MVATQAARDVAMLRKNCDRFLRMYSKNCFGTRRMPEVERNENGGKWMLKIEQTAWINLFRQDSMIRALYSLIGSSNPARSSHPPRPVRNKHEQLTMRNNMIPAP